MTDKEKTIKELKEALDSLDITNKYRLNLIRAIEYLQEEPVSEGLEEAINSYIENNFHGSQTLGFFSNRTKEEPNDEDIALTFKAGAEWQKEKDQETIETAIHHAYHNGRFEMKEQMMKNAIDAKIGSFTNSTIYDADFNIDSNLKDNDKVKIIIIKED